MLFQPVAGHHQTGAIPVEQLSRREERRGGGGGARGGGEAWGSRTVTCPMIRSIDAVGRRLDRTVEEPRVLRTPAPVISSTTSLPSRASVPPGRQVVRLQSMPTRHLVHRDPGHQRLSHLQALRLVRPSPLGRRSRKKLHKPNGLQLRSRWTSPTSDTEISAQAASQLTDSVDCGVRTALTIALHLGENIPRGSGGVKPPARGVAGRRQPFQIQPPPNTRLPSGA